MNSKAKLISTIAAICMVLVLLVGGIWAASSGTVTIGGTVSFSAQDVDVKITGVVTGASTASTPELDPIRWNAATANNKDGNSNLEDGLEDLQAAWDLGELQFTKAAADGKLNNIVLTITVENYSTERQVQVALTTTTPTAGDIAVAVAGDTTIGVASKTGDVVTPASAELTLTISTAKLSTDSIDATAFAGLLTVSNAGKPSTNP